MQHALNTASRGNQTKLLWGSSTGLHRLPPRAAKAIETQWANPIDDNVLNARPDPIDFRDCYYEPGLVQIKSRHIPAPLAAQGLSVRQQGREGSCTGQALAAVVDMQNIVRHQDGANVPKRVSARMLYESARQFDEFADDGLAGSSLRGALKGFFHRGVCDVAKAPYFDGDIGWHLTPVLAKDARRVGLGAYFRLRHELNAYHTAIMETGAVLCSAMVHDGWESAKVSARRGRIVLRSASKRGTNAPVPLLGAHAFAIVGYDEDGFLVLNSWGEEWGGFDPSRSGRNGNGHAGAGGLPGIAHWAYEDWRQHVLDAWVLRLCAPTGRPSGYIGGYIAGKSGAGGVSSVLTDTISIRDQKIRGHYIHVDDGVLVARPPYDNSELSLKDTADFLIANEDAEANRERYDHLVFYAHGGLNDLNTGTARAWAMTDVFKRLGIYPVFYLWRTGFSETLKDVLAGMLPRLRTRTEGFGGIADPLIESIARPLGRAVWRDMKLDASRAATPATGNGRIATGGAWKGSRILLEAAAARSKRPLKVHFIAHSGGAILLGELLNRLRKDAPELAETIATVDLFAPACTVEFFRDYVQPHTRKMAPGAFSVTNLNAPAEASPDPAMHPYAKSLLHLVSNAFEENRQEPIAGMDVFWQDHIAPRRPNIAYRLAGASGGIAKGVNAHGAFDNDPAMMNFTLSRILGRPINSRNGGFSALDVQTAEF